MAKRTRKKRIDPVIAIRPSIDVTEATPVYYVNYAEVSRAQHEFAISATRVPAKFPPQRAEEAAKTGTLSFEATVQLIIPLTMMEGLVSAVTAQLEGYKKSQLEKKGD